MSCNGCRILRKGCSDTCILRPCLHWIDSAEAQGHATVFVAKFFGRAGLMSSISAVPENQRPVKTKIKRPKLGSFSSTFLNNIYDLRRETEAKARSRARVCVALFQSLLFEAAGRTVSPVSGAVGLLWTGNWHVCQSAVETVLRGGALKPIPEFLGGGPTDQHDDIFKLADPGVASRWKIQKRRRSPDVMEVGGLDLSLSAVKKNRPSPEKRRLGSPSMNSEESVTTTCGDQPAAETQLLKLF